MLASFLCVAIVDGVGYTTGLMLERCLVVKQQLNTHLLTLSSLKSELGGSRGAVAVVGSLQVLFHFHQSMFRYLFSLRSVFTL